MRKIILIITLAFILSGCSNNVSDNPKEDPATEKEMEVLKTTEEIRDELNDIALPYMADGEYGLMNINGEKLFSTEESYIRPTFDDQYYIVGSEVRTINGSVVKNPGISGSDNMIFYLGEGYFVEAVREESLFDNERYSIYIFNVDKKGFDELPLRDVKHVGTFQNGVAMITGINENGEDYRTVYVGNNGKLIKSDILRDGSAFNSNGEALVLTEDNKYIYINNKGKQVRDTEYTGADFSIMFSCPDTDYIAISRWPGQIINNGKEETQDEGKCAYFNTVTEERTDLYDSLGGLDAKTDNSFANVYRDNYGWGYLDISSNEEIINCQYQSAGLFNEGLACVESDNMVGCITEENKTVVPFEYYGNIYFNNRGMWAVAAKILPIDVVLDWKYVFLQIDDEGNCVESEIPGVSEDDEIKDNIFNDKSQNCIIEVQYDSNGDHEIDTNRYINPWNGETVVELKDK